MSSSLSSINSPFYRDGAIPCASNQLIACSATVPARRRFLQSLAGMSLLAGSSFASAGAASSGDPDASQREKVNALLLSATTLKGRSSLEHGYEALRELYPKASRILLINFASLPSDRDAYEARMRSDFARLDTRFTLSSLHRSPIDEAGAAVSRADAFFVSGGNTFLLLKELYDRQVVDVLRERVLQGVPYAGSSAGSNIAGTVIGTTNDFPLVDIPTRRSLGVLPAVFNPHHPEHMEEADFASRQWKIGEYCRYHAEATVIGVTNPGLVRVQGNRCRLLGPGATAFIQRGNAKRVAASDEETADLSAAFEALSLER